MLPFTAASRIIGVFLLIVISIHALTGVDSLRDDEPVVFRPVELVVRWFVLFLCAAFAAGVERRGFAPYRMLCARSGGGARYSR